MTDEKHVSIAQVSGGVNISNAAPIMLGAINLVRGHRGVNIGVMNLSEKQCGVTIGIVNYARKLSGLQIGLLNIHREGSMPVMVGINVGRQNICDLD